VAPAAGKEAVCELCPQGSKNSENSFFSMIIRILMAWPEVAGEDEQGMFMQVTPGYGITCGKVLQRRETPFWAEWSPLRSFKIVQNIGLNITMFVNSV
jgi:hypothetical protein